MTEFQFTLLRKNKHDLSFKELDYLLNNCEEYLDYHRFLDLYDYRDYLLSLSEGHCDEPTIE